MEGSGSLHPADYSRFYGYPRVTLTPAQKAAKNAYDKAWAACQAFAPTDWSDKRKKAYREARDAWFDFLQTLKLDATGR
jgi:hypothetical protein